MYELYYIHPSAFAMTAELKHSKHDRVIIEIPSVFSQHISKLKHSTEQTIDENITSLQNTISDYNLKSEGSRFSQTLENLKHIMLSGFFLKNLAQDIDTAVSEQIIQLLLHSLRDIFPDIQLINTKPTPGVYLMPIYTKLEEAILQFSSADCFTIFLKVAKHSEVEIYSNHLTHCEARVLFPFIGLEPPDIDLLEKEQVPIVISFNDRVLFVDSYAAFDPTGIKLLLRKEKLKLTTVLAPAGVLAGNVLADMLPSLNQPVLTTWVTQRYICIVTKTVPDLTNFENYDLFDEVRTKEIDFFELVGAKILSELDELAGEIRMT